MRKLLLIGITSIVASALTFTTTFSAQWDVQRKNEEMKARVLEKYDYNGNGVLDPEELKALKEDNDATIKRAKERMLELLDRYDLNKNGRLDPEEREIFLKNGIDN